MFLIEARNFSAYVFFKDHDDDYELSHKMACQIISIVQQLAKSIDAYFDAPAEGGYRHRTQSQKKDSEGIYLPCVSTVAPFLQNASSYPLIWKRIDPLLPFSSA